MKNYIALMLLISTGLSMYAANQAVVVEDDLEGFLGLPRVAKEAGFLIKSASSSSEEPEEAAFELNEATIGGFLAACVTSVKPEEGATPSKLGQFGIEDTVRAGYSVVPGPARSIAKWAGRTAASLGQKAVDTGSYIQVINSETATRLTEKITSVDQVLAEGGMRLYDTKTFEELLVDAYTGKSEIVKEYIANNRELLKQVNKLKWGLLPHAAFGYISGNNDAWHVLILLLKAGAPITPSFDTYLTTVLEDKQQQVRLDHIKYVVEMAKRAAKAVVEEFPEYPEDPSLIQLPKTSSSLLGWMFGY